jgi:exonuclease SbcD
VLTAILALPRGGAGSARPLLEVEVRLDKPEPTLRQRIEEALRGKEARLARLGVTLTGTGEALGDVEARAISELQPEEVFRAKWRKHHEGDPPAELLLAFHELVDLVHQADA